MHQKTKKTRIRVASEKNCEPSLWALNWKLKMIESIEELLRVRERKKKEKIVWYFSTIFFPLILFFSSFPFPHKEWKQKHFNKSQPQKKSTNTHRLHAYIETRSHLCLWGEFWVAVEWGGGGWFFVEFYAVLNEILFFF